jgi:LAO/AO transport system kinase
VDQLVAIYRARGINVGVVAVDPSSPFTGGAILGDRIRMGRHYTDPGVFIRSMATRGHLGGLARATGEAVLVLDAMGCGVVFVETVGVGQGEVDVVRLAHAVVLVQAPGGGDEIQAAKAGIMEIGDVFAVNKARRAGADRTVKEIEEMLDLRHPPAGHPGAGDGWRPPVLRTEATEGEGVEELARAIDARCAYLEDHPGEAARLRREQARHLLTEILRDLAAERVLRSAGSLEALLDAIAARREDPYSAARAILEKG